MAGYTRVDTINNIADGNIINADDLDGEFDGVQAAFNSSTGHNHDGTAGGGAPILALGPVQDVTISTTVLGVKTTNTVDLGTTGLRFKDFYLAGTASIGTLSVTGNTTLGDASTDTVTVNGYMGVGGAGTANVGVRIVSTALTGATQVGAYSTFTASSAATASVWGFLTAPATAATAFTATNMAGYSASDVTKGAGSTITNQHGVYISDQTQGTNNYGITSLVSNGTNKFNIYASGTADNAFAGNVRIGSVTAPTNALDVTGNITVTGNTTLGDASTDTVTVNGYMGVGGAANSANALTVGSPTLSGTTQRGIDSATTFGTGATASVQQIRAISTLTTAGVYAEWIGLNVPQPQGTGYTLTNAYGLYISDQTKGTNNYGITSLVSSGTNKWNIYASGTADNYFAGDVGIGTNSPTTKLQVSDTAANSISIERVASAIGSSTQLGAFVGIGQIPTLTAQAASIQMLGDGTWSATSAPSKIIFNTTPSSSTTLTERMRIDSNGDTSIKTATGALLTLSTSDNIVQTGDVLGGINFQAPNEASGSQAILVGASISGVASVANFNATNNNTDLVFSTNATLATPTERMRIDSSGNVGIGTSSPSTKLEVAGTTNLSWTVTASVSGTTMDVTGVTSGTIAVGDLVFGVNIQPYTRVTALGTGTGGIGTYTVSVSQTSASGSVSGAAVYANTLIRITDTDTSANIGQPTGALQFYTSDVSAPTAGVGAYVAALAETSTPDTALIFGTRDNGGGGIDANERMRITSSGSVFIGQKTGGYTFEATDTAGSAIVGKFNTASTGSYLAFGDATSSATSSAPRIGAIGDSFVAFTTGTQRMTIDSSGNVLVGATTARTVLAGTITPILQVEGTATNASSVSIIRNANTAGSEGILLLGKSRGTAVGSVTSVVANDYLGEINFQGADGTNMGQAAAIIGQAEGTISTGTVPGRLTLHTTNSSGTITERMRIDSSGNVGIGVTPSATGGRLQVVGTTNTASAQIAGNANGMSVLNQGGLTIYTNLSGASTDTTFVAGNTATTYMAFGIHNGTSYSERMRIDSSGNVGIGTSPPTQKLHVSGTTATSVLIERVASAIGSSTQLGGFIGAGQIPTLTADGASIQMIGDGTWSSTSAPSKIVFNTVSSGSTTLGERMRIDSSGNVGIGVTPVTLLNAYSATSAIISVDGDTTAIVRPTRYSTDASSPQFLARKARGTLASPTAVATSDNAGGMYIQAYGGTNFRTIARIDGFVETYTSDTNIAGSLRFYTNTSSTDVTEKMRIDSVGNAQFQTGAVMPYAPAPASISTTATLTNANIQAQIINTTGTTYTVTMPLGTTMETLATWATTGIGYDFTVINTASGTITMAVNTGVTSLGGLTIATGVSAQFRIRRTAANTFVLYRLG